MLYHVYVVINPESNNLLLQRELGAPNPLGGGTGSKKLFGSLKIPLCCSSAALVLEWRSFCCTLERTSRHSELATLKHALVMFIQEWARMAFL